MISLRAIERQPIEGRRTIERRRPITLERRGTLERRREAPVESRR